MDLSGNNFGSRPDTAADAPNQSITLGVGALRKPLVGLEDARELPAGIRSISPSYLTALRLSDNKLDKCLALEMAYELKKIWYLREPDLRGNKIEGNGAIKTVN